MGLRTRLFARYYDRLQAGYERQLGDRRARLLAEVEGRVLELGPGTGVNFAHFPRRARGTIEWIGLEPNEHMRERLAPRAREHGFEPRFADLDGRRLGCEDRSVDVVLCTLVLCSVPDPAATLREIRRVLRPGGRFLFMEHVGAGRGTWERRLQACLTPAWRCFADGCRLDRETARSIEDAGFDSVELESFRCRLPHVSGVARR